MSDRTPLDPKRWEGATPGPWAWFYSVTDERVDDPPPGASRFDLRTVKEETGRYGPLPTWVVCGDQLGENPADARLCADAPTLARAYVEMRQALEWFVGRCERGEVRSIRSRARFEEILARYAPQEGE